MSEVWKSVPTLPDVYEVSNLGRVRSWILPGRFPNRRRIKPVIRKQVPNCRDGRLQCMFVVDKKKVLRPVHRLVLEAFVGLRPTGTECRHKDGNQLNNVVANLAWGTHAENLQDKILHGTYQYNEKNHNCKLSNAQVVEIRNSTDPLKIAAARYGVSIAQISRIRNDRQRLIENGKALY